MVGERVPSCPIRVDVVLDSVHPPAPMQGRPPILKFVINRSVTEGLFLSVHPIDELLTKVTALNFVIPTGAYPDFLLRGNDKTTHVAFEGKSACCQASNLNGTSAERSERTSVRALSQDPCLFSSIPLSRTCP